MIKWPEDLVKDIAKRRSVLYLGSGISANSKSSTGKRPATWESFLQSILEKHNLGGQRELVESLLKNQDYLTACEILVDGIGEHQFGEEAANEFRRPGYEPHEIHEIIYGLDSRIVITPNIDKIYEQYAATASRGTYVTKNYYDEDVAKYLRSPDYLIIKAHGTVDTTNKIIFTHKQYSKARYEYATFYKILDALMLTHTFIFLGCGITDPDIQLILENYNFSFPGCRPHYFVTANDNFANKISKTLKVNRNISVITYDNEDGKHTDLLESLKELSELVDAEKMSIQSECSW